MNESASANTDREIWRETPGDYYSPSIHVTKDGGIGINIGGKVIVHSPADWHELASDTECLSEWISGDDEESAKSIIGDCPREILQMVAILVNLDITTRDHAGDLAADGFVFRADETIERADKYRESINALVAIWGEPEDDDSEIALTLEGEQMSEQYRESPDDPSKLDVGDV